MPRTSWAILGLLLVSTVFAQNPPAPSFRTDTSNPELPWFRLRPGEFPAEGSAHYIGGELIALDRINRTGTIRLDRTDAQKRSSWDKLHDFALLPYGMVRYQGAPAELRDIPLGTHLHGYYYAIDSVFKRFDQKGKKPVAPLPEVRDEAFSLAFLLEDDFSYSTRLQRLWRIDSIDTEKGTITTTGVGLKGEKPDAKQTMFHFTNATKIMKGKGFGTLADLAPGQTILVNLTIATMRGPGRCTTIWLDDESRALASAQQTEVHRLYQRERGLAGWIDEVDNKQGTVTVTLFGGIDPELLKPIVPQSEIAVAVAEETLRTYSPLNDVKKGPVLEIKTLPPQPGSSGFQVKIKPSLLLEGFRPKRIVRLYPWPVSDLPKEEQQQ